MSESLPRSGDTPAESAARRARFAEDNVVRELPRLVAEAQDETRLPADRFGSALDATELLAKSTARVRRWAAESKLHLALAGAASSVEEEHQGEVEDRAREVELAFQHALDVNQEPRRVPGHIRLTTPARIVDGVREWIQSNPDMLQRQTAPTPPFATAAAASRLEVADLTPEKLGITRDSDKKALKILVAGGWSGGDKHCDSRSVGRLRLALEPFGWWVADGKTYKGPDGGKGYRLQQLPGGSPA